MIEYLHSQIGKLKHNRANEKTQTNKNPSKPNQTETNDVKPC